MDWKTFEKKWLKAYVPGLAMEDYARCHVEQYLWHVFSYELIAKTDRLEGDAARAAYEAADKEGAFAIRKDFTAKNPETVPYDHEKHCLKKLEKQQETFVVGRDFSWTYISTHENGWCGPYFCRKPKAPWEKYWAV